MTNHQPSFKVETENIVPASIDWTKTTSGETDIRVIVGQYKYDYRFNRRCLTCMIGDPWIDQINRQAVLGVFATQIMRELPKEVQDKMSIQSLRGHINNHLGETALYHQAMLAAFRSCIGIASDQYPEQLNAEMAARTVMMTGVKGIATGRIDVKTSDVLNAAKMVQDIEDRTAQKDQAALFGEAAQIIMASARESMSDDAYNQLVWRLQSNERIREIMAVLRGDPPRPDFDYDDGEEALEIEQAPSSVLA